MAEGAILLCVPWEDPARHLVPGTRKGNCARCDREVAVAPSSEETLKRTGATIVCTPCLMAEAKEKTT